MTSTYARLPVGVLTNDYSAGDPVEFMYRWEGGSRFEITANGASALTVNVMNPRKIFIDVILTVARTKRQAIGSILERLEDGEGNGTWFVDSKAYIPLNSDVEDLLNKIVKEWGLRLLESL